MIITSEMRWNKMLQLEALLLELLGRDSVAVEKELTMNKAKKILGMGKDKIVSEIKEKKLRASVKRKRVTKKGITKLFDYYTFRMSDLIEYQQCKFQSNPVAEIDNIGQFNPKKFVEDFHNKRKAS